MINWMIALIIFIFLAMVLCLVESCQATDDHINLGKKYCHAGYVQGSGNIDYCAGKPFICDNNKCWDVQKPVVGESCHKECLMVGKIVNCTTKCEEILN